MTIEEMIENGIWLEQSTVRSCPVCGYPMEHSFRLNTFHCRNCGRNDNEFDYYMEQFRKMTEE